MSVLLLILGLLLFVSLVVVHEFGHFIVARRNGVEVEEFAIGFPPRAYKRLLKNGTLLTLNWLPLGGFVKLKGEHDADRTKGSYGRASLWTKTKIMLAGVGMNLLAAWALLTFLALVGIPKVIDNQFMLARDEHIVKQQVLVGYVEPGSPADKAGLKTRDRIVSIKNGNNEYKFNEASQLPKATEANGGQTVQIQYERSGKAKLTSTTLRSYGEVTASQQTDSCTKQTYLAKGYLGISPSEFSVSRATWSAPVVGVGLIGQFTKLTLAGLGHAFGGLLRGKPCVATQQVSGPVGIFVILKDGSLLGYQFMLMIIAIISLTLAIMNVLPIPALDGGRLFVTLLFRAIKKPLTKKKEEWIHGIGFGILIVLLLLITIVDIRRF